MYACICGFNAETEGDLMSHVLERHCRSYGLETCTYTGPNWAADSTDRPLAIHEAELELARY